MNAYYSFYFKKLIFLHFPYFVNSKILTFSYTYLKTSYFDFSFILMIKINIFMFFWGPICNVFLFINNF